MEAFKVRKYGNPSGRGGSVSTNISINGFYEIRTMRGLIFGTVSVLMVLASEDFEFFYEVFTHVPPPYHKILHENAIPAAVKVPND